jgi:hypothetical protein
MSGPRDTAGVISTVPSAISMARFTPKQNPAFVARLTSKTRTSLKIVKKTNSLRHFKIPAIY